MKQLYTVAKPLRAMMAAVAALSMTTACVTTDNGQTAGFPKVSNTVWQACAGGAVLGALTTLLVNDDVDIGDIALGAGVGALAGCAVGGIVDQRRQKFADTADYFDSEIARTRTLNTQVATVNTKLTSVIAENRTQLSSLKSQQASATLDRDAAKALRSKTRAELKWAEQQLKNADAELQAQQIVLTKAEEEAASTAKTTELRAQVSSLKQTVSNLETQVAELNSVSEAVGQFAA